MVRNYIMGTQATGIGSTYRYSVPPAISSRWSLGLKIPPRHEQTEWLSQSRKDSDGTRLMKNELARTRAKTWGYP